MTCQIHGPFTSIVLIPSLCGLPIPIQHHYLHLSFIYFLYVRVGTHGRQTTHSLLFRRYSPFLRIYIFPCPCFWYQISITYSALHNALQHEFFEIVGLRCHAQAYVLRAESFRRKFRDKIYSVSVASQISDRVCEGTLPWENEPPLKKFGR